MDQKISWLRLIRAENVGPATFRAMVNHYGSAADALEALPQFARRGGARPPRIPTVEEAEAELALTERAGATLVALGEPAYPPRLREIAAAPPLVTVRGNLDILTRPMVAIVGSRNASIAGSKIAERIARGLGEQGYVVVSGLARGIDAAAHRASLASGTVAVIAGGIDHVYPEEHGPLSAAISGGGGAVLTEMPFGWIPRAQDFPRRNRLVSGLALGVVVVEAASRSGTLHTARFALEQNREVFAVPGSPLDARADGTNDLIRRGATLVRHADDVVEVLDPLIRTLPFPKTEANDPTHDDRPPQMVDAGAVRTVLAALGPVPTAIDDIVLHTGLQARVVAAVVLDLELEGRIERHGGQLISLIS
ncbi:DNA-processing protein DprA [Chthonobacter albigriseus]|uniref:DNA-processing protein DprA n=1 Tax=Chthonobacter albigriseus TaxID=1683161 RepID=UPI001FCF0919|nr:DNA-processing protein DprA [Chthonobacter albigriseus]